METKMLLLDRFLCENCDMSEVPKESKKLNQEPLSVTKITHFFLFLKPFQRGVKKISFEQFIYLMLHMIQSFVATTTAKIPKAELKKLVIQTSDYEQQLKEKRQWSSDVQPIFLCLNRYLGITSE
jgi:hypothetical protein